MTKICNFGSINIDHVYRVTEFVKPGETIQSISYRIFPGGKGLNQSIALVRAGAEVFHAGAVGKDGDWLINRLADEGVLVDFIEHTKSVTGHAIIQVAESGENSIILHGGANRMVSSTNITRILGNFSKDDYCLLQNEINGITEIMNEASRRQIKIVFNPAPMTPEVQNYPLDKVAILIINQVEGAILSNNESPKDIVQSLREKYEDTAVLLSLGTDGLIYSDNENQWLKLPARAVDTVDTTAAGDTLIGYFLASLINGLPVSEALEIGTIASALCVMKHGAADSIPTAKEVAHAKTTT